MFDKKVRVGDIDLPLGAETINWSCGDKFISLLCCVDPDFTVFATIKNSFMQMHLLWAKKSIFLTCNWQTRGCKMSPRVTEFPKGAEHSQGGTSVLCQEGWEGHQSKAEHKVLKILPALRVVWDKALEYRSLKWTYWVWGVCFLIYNHSKLSAPEKL